MQIYINNMEYLCSNCNEMKKLAEFISVHLNDDTSRLLLAKDKWPEIDMNLAVNCIESRRKLKGNGTRPLNSYSLQRFLQNNAAVHPQPVTRQRWLKG